jgi:hypothetical protein
MALSLDDTRRAYPRGSAQVSDIRCEASIEALAPERTERAYIADLRHLGPRSAKRVSPTDRWS